MSEPFDTYKKLRNRIADLSFEDSFAAAWAYSQYTQIKDFAFPTDIKPHPSFSTSRMVQPYCWQLETIVREVVLHASIDNRRGKSLKRWGDLAEAINALRMVEDAIHKKTLTSRPLK